MKNSFEHVKDTKTKVKVSSKQKVKKEHTSFASFMDDKFD